MKQAFTLVELLVVVLIIGVLTSIAIPMYQGAVDKSHWSTMLPGAKAIKDAEEAIKMTNGEYTSQMDDLDVTMNNENLNFTLTTPNNMSDPNVIRVTNPKLANVRLANYLDDSPKFAGQLHCETTDGEGERGQRLCEKLLGGQELTSADGYTSYLLDQAIDKATCGQANLVWSNKQTNCYRTEQDRCTANGMPYNDSTGLCGYKGNSGTEDEKLVIEEGAKCIVYGYNNCNYLQVEEDGVCEGQGVGCSQSEFKKGSQCLSIDSYACWNSSFWGAVCEGNNSYSCRRNVFSNGAVCMANGNAACSSEENAYSSESKCIGNGVSSCQYGTFDDSTCEGNTGQACSYAKFENGSICVANDSTSSGSGVYTCGQSSFKSGSKCVANAPGTCATSGWRGVVTYDGGCCEGQYCPSDAPKC